MYKDFDGFIFDFDGTLVDSMWIWPIIDREYLESRGIVYDENLKYEIEGISFYQTAQYFKDKFSIEDSIEKIMEDWEKQAYDKYRNEVTLKPGIREFLERIRKDGKRTGIATSNNRSLVGMTLRALDIEHLFDFIATSDEVKNGKPEPDIFLFVAQKLGVPTNKCVAFEDVVAGIMAGRNAGMKVVAIEDDFSSEMRDKKRELSDYYIEDYRELL